MTPDLDLQLAALAKQRRRRIAARRRLYAEHRQARAHGLAARHARRLAEVEARLREAATAGTEDSWWEEP